MGIFPPPPGMNRRNLNRGPFLSKGDSSKSRVFCWLHADFAAKNQHSLTRFFKVQEIHTHTHIPPAKWCTRSLNPLVEVRGHPKTILLQDLSARYIKQGHALFPSRAASLGLSGSDGSAHGAIAGGRGSGCILVVRS